MIGNKRLLFKKKKEERVYAKELLDVDLTMSI